jgi:homoaconitase/3-isopropylmalate dehydratase large subunit
MRWSMGFTAIEKILMNHAVEKVDNVSPGDIITAWTDYRGIHEGFSAVKFEMFNELGKIKGFYEPQKFGVFLGHHLCSSHSDEVAANQQRTREWAANLGLKVFDLGTGICHVQMMEQGIAYPGRLCVFSDSHTLGCGAVGAMGVQCGAELIETVLTGKMWLKVPQTHKYIIDGQTQKGVYPRDIIQYIIKVVGMDASVYKAIEWSGSYIHSLPIPLRFPFTFMSVELGGKTSFIEPDDITLEYEKNRVQSPFEIIRSDADAKIEQVFTFDVTKIGPQVAAPSAPDKTQPVEEAAGARIDQVCIGTCCGSSIYDMRAAAKILQGKRVKARTLIVPGTREVLSQSAAEGLLQIFVDSGADLLPPHCGTCQTLSVAHLAPGETQMHPGPRNWTGRTADGSFSYLASPATCAASAIEGKVADPRNYL